MKQQYLIAFILIFFLNLSTFASSEAKSDHLSAIPPTLTNNNRAQFAQEMNGEMSNYWKNLGALSDDNSHFQNLYLLLSDAKSRAQSPNTIHIGLLPLPYSKREFLAWVYWESTSDRSKRDRYGFFTHLNSKLSFGIVQKNELNSFELKKHLKPIVNLDIGEDTELASFDFANYELGSLGRAIGLRTTIHSCGVGGSICSNEEIRLYSLNTPQIREVFRSTIAYFGVYAGDWHKDLTRDHFSEELLGVVIIESKKNKNEPQILIKTTFRNLILQRRFVVKKNRQNLNDYQSTDPEIFPRVDRQETFEVLERKNQTKSHSQNSRVFIND